MKPEVVETRVACFIKPAGPRVYVPIQLWVSDEEVGGKIGMSDFLDGLVEQIGNPTFLVTKAALRAKLETATEVIMQKMKDETVKLPI